MLAAVGGEYQSGLAAILRSRALGLFGLWLVLAIRLFVGLGAIPLWPLVPSLSFGLVLAAGPCLGAVLGILEIFE